MKKKIVSAVLALCMTLSLAACGDSDSSSKADESKAETTTSAAASEAEESKAEEASSAAESKAEESKADESKAEEPEAEAVKLEYWAEDSKVKQSIEEWVKEVTDPSSDKFIPVEDRIVVSDVDGTLIGELYPCYFDFCMFVHRALYDDTYNAPDDMIGQWEFEPSKTRKHKVKCITFNSTHASNIILQNLRHIKNQYFPTKNKRDNLNLTISKKDPLFGSRTNKYKKPLNAKSVADHWWKKNKKFRQWKITQIKQKMEQGELSSEDFDEEVEKIPKFHPHVCRKFFITTVSNHCGDFRVSALFEGHSDGPPNDKSYVKKSLEDICDIY